MICHDTRFGADDSLDSQCQMVRDS